MLPKEYFPTLCQLLVQYFLLLLILKVINLFVNFVPLNRNGGGGGGQRVCKIDVFPYYSWTYIRQTEYIVMMTKEVSNKIVNLMTPRAGVLVLGRGHKSHIVKMHFILLKSSGSSKYIVH